MPTPYNNFNLVSPFLPLQKDYKEFIQNLSDSNSPNHFYTSSSSDGVIVMAAIFRKVKQVIRIYTGCFSDDISKRKEYLDALQEALLRGVKFKILINQSEYNKLGENTDVLNMLKYFSLVDPNQITLKLRNESVKFTPNSSEVHFTIGDEVIYRMETDVRNLVAEASFNDPETSKILANIFDRISDASTPINFNQTTAAFAHA